MKNTKQTADQQIASTQDNQTEVLSELQENELEQLEAQIESEKQIATEPQMTSDGEIKTEPAAPVIKTTAVTDREYTIAKPEKIGLVKSKQASIVLAVMQTRKQPMRIKEVAAEAAKLGLKAVGGVEPSVRYHLHHLTKAGITKVENPTFEVI
jgi:hypothetical protein